MAETVGTLNNLILLNDKNLADIDVSTITNKAPLMDVIYSKVASNGTAHKFLRETTGSSATFRNVNGGVVKTKSADELVTQNLKVLDGTFDVDVAYAKGYTKGVDACLERETGRSLSQSMVSAEAQVIYGTGNSSDGFEGIADILTAGQIVTAGGSTTDSQTAVYLIRSADDAVAFVLGNDGEMAVEEPSVIQKVTDSETGASYPAFYVPITGFAGLQVAKINHVAAVKNVETSLTDNMIYDAISRFPASEGPTHIIMSRKGQKLLRQSRTATNATGAPAPLPTDLGGIPIIVTDNVSDTEAVYSA